MHLDPCIADLCCDKQIQGMGAILVDRIEGSFDNVVGLPLRTTLKMIEKIVLKVDDEDIMGDGDLLEDEDEE